MRKSKTFLICTIVVLVCLTSSCSSTRRVSVADGLAVDLLPASAISQTIDAYQLMDGTIPGYGEAVLESYMVAGPEGIDLYLFAPTGQTIAHVVYDGQRATMESDFIPHGDVAARYMAFDIQMCYADTRVIEESGLEVNEVSGERRTREISYDGRLLYRIVFVGNTLTLENIQRGYSYMLETLE